MTFEQYLKNLKPELNYIDLKMWLVKLPIDNLILLAENWHAHEFKSMSRKGANTTNSKYSKEQRSEWAKMGAVARMKNVDKSQNIKK